jgi:DNA invertase Pin-like site-specific DNA recombinase
MTDLVAITSKLKAKGVELQILSMNLDTSTPTGKLMLNLMGCFAEFKREIMLERQREALQRPKQKGSTRGRALTAQRRAAEGIQSGVKA